MPRQEPGDQLVAELGDEPRVLVGRQDDRHVERLPPAQDVVGGGLIGAINNRALPLERQDSSGGGRAIETGGHLCRRDDNAIEVLKGNLDLVHELASRTGSHVRRVAHQRCLQSFIVAEKK